MKKFRSSFDYAWSDIKKYQENIPNFLGKLRKGEISYISGKSLYSKENRILNKKLGIHKINKQNH